MRISDWSSDVCSSDLQAHVALVEIRDDTTAGCLTMLDRLARQGMTPRHIADISTGTGLLAFAALSLWPRARAIASDIDPASIRVTRENAAINGVALGRTGGRLALAVAPGDRKSTRLNSSH